MRNTGLDEAQAGIKIGGSDGKASAHNAGDLGLIPGLGRSPGGGHGTNSSTLNWRIPCTKETGGSKSWTGLWT